MRIRARCSLRLPSRSSSARSSKHAVVPIKAPTDISQTELATSRFFASHRPLLDLDLLSSHSSASSEIKITTSSSSNRSAADSSDSADFTLHTINITASSSAQPTAHSVTHATALLQYDNHRTHHPQRSIVIPSSLWSSKPKSTVTPDQFNQLIDELAAPAPQQDQAHQPSPKVITSAIKLLANDSYLTSRNAAVTRAVERGESPLLAQRLGVESELVVLGEANGPRVEWARGVALWLAENGRAYVSPPAPIRLAQAGQELEQKSRSLTRRERMRSRRQAYNQMMVAHSSPSARGRVRSPSFSTSIVNRYSRSFSRQIPAYMQARLSSGADYFDEDVGIPVVISDPEACVNIALMDAENALSSPAPSSSSSGSRTQATSDSTTTITLTKSEATTSPESSTAVVEVGENGIRPHLRAVLQQLVDREVKESQASPDSDADGKKGEPMETSTPSAAQSRAKGTIAFIVTSSEQARDLSRQLRKGESLDKIQQRAVGRQQVTAAQDMMLGEIDGEEWEAVEVEHDEHEDGFHVVGMSRQGMGPAQRRQALVEEEDYDEDDHDDGEDDMHGDLPPADPNMLLSHALVQARLADALPSANALTLIDDALAKLKTRSTGLSTTTSAVLELPGRSRDGSSFGLMDLSTLNADLSDIQNPALRAQAKEAASERRKSLEATAKALSASISKLPLPEGPAGAPLNGSNHVQEQAASSPVPGDEHVGKPKKGQSSAGAGAAFTLQGRRGGAIKVDVNGLMQVHRRSSHPTASASTSTSTLDAEVSDGKEAGGAASKGEAAALRRGRAKRTARYAAMKAAQKARVK